MYIVTTDQLNDALGSLTFDFLKGNDLAELSLFDGVIKFQCPPSSLNYCLSLLDDLGIKYKLR